MREQFVQEFISRLDGKLSCDCLRTVLNELSVFVKDYEISPAETSLAVINEIPNEFKAYIVTKKIEGRSDGTLRLYTLRLTNMYRTIGKRTEDITQNDIRIYLYGLQKESGMSDRTLDGLRHILNGYFGWCLNEGYIHRNPCAAISPIKFEEKPRVPFSDTEMEMIRGACKTKRDKAIIETLYSTGCRCSELHRLERADVNLETREVRLFGKGKKHRVSYLNARAVVALKVYLASRADDNEKLFVTEKAPKRELTTAAVEKIVRNIGKRAGIDNCFPHRFRHTMASDGLEHGMPVTDLQKLLGHTKLETTMIYAKTSQTLVSSSHKRFIV